MRKITNPILVALSAVVMSAQMPIATAAVVTVSSLDVPKAIPDDNFAGITSVLTGPSLFNLTDVNLIFDELLHTSIPDLHIELQSPGGTTVTLVKAFTENGILTGLGTPDDFVDTVLDDQAPTNLSNGAAPYTGSFNVNHASVVLNPLSIFNGEDAIGTWTLFVSDRADVDIGTLNDWSIQFTGVPEPASISLLGMGLLICAGLWFRRRR